MTARELSFLQASIKVQEKGRAELQAQLSKTPIVDPKRTHLQMQIDSLSTEVERAKALIGGKS